jgi:hypothetical protein
LEVRVLSAAPDLEIGRRVISCPSRLKPTWVAAVAVLAAQSGLSRRLRVEIFTAAWRVEW